VSCFEICSVMCFMESLPSCSEISTQAPRAPLSANAVRNSFPKPRAAPVTTQVLPSRENEGRVIRDRLWRTDMKDGNSLLTAARREVATKRDIVWRACCRPGGFV
jgi:hypothetical protein